VATGWGAADRVRHKTRDPDVANAVVANRVVGDIAGRTCLLIDDMITTGGSITQAAELLFQERRHRLGHRGATHGVLSPPATDRLKNSQVSESSVTNTLRSSPEQAFDKLTVLSIAPMIAQAIVEGLRRRLGDQPLRRPQQFSRP